MKSVFRYDNHMPKTDDLTLIVLKGHLLIEELLVDLANLALPHAQYLPPKLSFHNLAHVVRATVQQRSDDACWELILELNTLRNDLAHKLESTKRQTTVSKLFRIHGQVQPTPGIDIDKSAENSLNDAERLRLVVQDGMKFLLTLIFEYRDNAKKAKPKPQNQGSQ